MNRFPWEFTAEEFLGPRIIGSVMDPEYAAGRRASLSRLSGGPRVELDGVWVEYRPEGALVFDEERGGRVVGALAVGGEWSLDPKFQGRGLATKIDAEYLTRFGKSPEVYLDHGTITKEAERLVLRVHSLCVQKAVERGISVEPRVLRSVEGASERFEALRAGDDSALEQLSAREQRHKRCSRRRYRWIVVSSSLINWLRGSNVPRLELRRFEKSVVVID